MPDLPNNHFISLNETSADLKQTGASIGDIYDDIIQRNNLNGTPTLVIQFGNRHQSKVISGYLFKDDSGTFNFYGTRSDSGNLLNFHDMSLYEFYCSLIASNPEIGKYRGGYEER